MGGATPSFLPKLMHRPLVPINYTPPHACLPTRPLPHFPKSNAFPSSVLRRFLSRAIATNIDTSSFSTSKDQILL